MERKMPLQIKMKHNFQRNTLKVFLNIHIRFLYSIQHFIDNIRSVGLGSPHYMIFDTELLVALGLEAVIFIHM